MGVLDGIAMFLGYVGLLFLAVCLLVWVAERIARWLPNNHR